MKIRQITNKLLRQYPLSLQEEWDESGYLNKGNLDTNINKCFVCLDLNKKTIDQAIKNKIKLIVSHHPIFHKDKKAMNSASKELLNKIKKHNITVLSLHTCFDLSDVGMNMLIGTKLKLDNLKWYDGKQFVVGNFKSQLTVSEIASLFERIFDVSILTTNAKNSDKFSKLAICAGSGLSCFAPKFDELKKQKILLVTGDVKHHGWQDLNEYGLKLLDVGHDLENCFSEFMANYIKQECDVDCLAITTSKKEHVI